VKDNKTGGPGADVEPGHISMGASIARFRFAHAKARECRLPTSALYWGPL